MDFSQLNTNSDWKLSEAQRQEWNAIYASCRSGSILTGKVAGIDRNTVSLTDPENGRQFDTEVLSLVMIDYRVKVLIPEKELWLQEEAPPSHILRSMAGATIDYVITDIDKDNECCVASRRQGMLYRRYTFRRDGVEVGDKATARILAVGSLQLLAECYGYDATLHQRDISYNMLPDLRERYHPGDEYPVVITGYDEEKDQLRFSMKEVEPHPFEGVETRHPIGSRRSSVITGKYRGGVFCQLDESMNCLCTYSAGQCDEDFRIGDQVILVITKYNYAKKQVYAKIIAKW